MRIANYGLTVIEKETREQNGIQNLTMDFSTDSRGNVLSKNYTGTGGYHGELFAVSDNSGNIDEWVTASGFINYAAILDPNNAYIDPREVHNPNDINVPLGWNEKKGNNITIQQVGTGNDLIFNAGGNSFSITNLWGAINITDSTTTTTTDDTTDKDGGDGHGYTTFFIDILDLCECDPPLGFKSGIISGDFTGRKHNEGQDTPVEDMSCEQLGNAMKWAKDEYDFINDAYHDGKYGDIDDPESAVETFEKDPDPCRTMSFDLCETSEKVFHLIGFYI